MYNNHPKYKSKAQIKRGEQSIPWKSGYGYPDAFNEQLGKVLKKGDKNEI